MNFIRPSGAEFELPEIIDEGTVYRFFTESKPLRLHGKDRLRVIGATGAFSGRTVFTDGESLIEIESAIIKDENGKVVDKLWITNRLSGTWLVT